MASRSTTGPVAQWIRHRPTELGIAGSSPAGVRCSRFNMTQRLCRSDFSSTIINSHDARHGVRAVYVFALDCSAGALLPAPSPTNASSAPPPQSQRASMCNGTRGATSAARQRQNQTSRRRGAQRPFLARAPRRPPPILLCSIHCCLAHRNVHTARLGGTV